MVVVAVVAAADVVVGAAAADVVVGAAVADVVVDVAAAVVPVLWIERSSVEPQAQVVDLPSTCSD